MSILSGMFPFAFWVISTRKCEAVIFPEALILGRATSSRTTRAKRGAYFIRAQ